MLFWKSREIRLEMDKIEDAVREASEFRELDKNFSSRINDLRNVLSRLQQSVGALNSRTSGSKFSNIVKNRFCSRAQEVLDAITYPDSILAAGDFYEDMAQRLGELSSLNVKEFRHLHAFRSEMKAVADTIRAVENSANEIGKILNYPVSKKAVDTSSKLEEIRNLGVSIGDAEGHLRKINEEAAEAEYMLKAKRKEMQSALESAEYMRVQEIGKEIERLKKDARIIETKISEEFASIERAFRKFAHFDAFEKELVDKYIDDGFAAFLDDEDGKIKIILERMRAAVETGKIAIESRKHEKLVDIIRSMGLFESLRHRYKDLKNELGKMADDMPTIERDIARLQREVEDGEHEIAKLRKDMESNIKRRDEAVQRIEELRSDIAMTVSGILGKRVVIN